MRWLRAAALTALSANAVGACTSVESNHPAGSSAGAPAATNSVPPSTLPGASARCATSALAPRTLRRLTRGELQNAIRDIFPTVSARWTGVDLGPDPTSTQGFDNDGSALLVGQQTAEEILATAKDVASLVTDAAILPGILTCAATTADEACAGQFIDAFGPRLYRRPLEAEERGELVDLYRSASARAGFAIGLKWSLVAMLDAPAFLYRSELGDDTGTLTAYERATELAFTYGGSTPGPELLAKASSGALATSDALEAEARALASTPSGQESLRAFFREWAGYGRIIGTDRAGVGDFTKSVASLLAEETKRFIDGIVLDDNGSVRDLLTSPMTYMSSPLAAFYGYGTGTDSFAPVARPAGRGIGLLAQASILASLSHYDFTSPTFRGLFVYSKLLCRQPLTRPAGVPAVEDAMPANTTRERYEKQHEHGSCAACHQSFEPFGYGLEHFDATGRYRDNENGYDIDARASVALDPATTIAFDGLEDLAHKLAALPEVTDCVSGLMASYFFGGAGGQNCLAEENRESLEQGKIGLRDFYLSLARSPSFSARAR
jgi:hypothetical protein